MSHKSEKCILKITTNPICVIAFNTVKFPYCHHFEKKKSFLSRPLNNFKNYNILLFIYLYIYIVKSIEIHPIVKMICILLPVQ